MTDVAVILGISGSLRSESYNGMLLREAAAVAPTGAKLVAWSDLVAVPPFSEDTENNAGPAVHALRADYGLVLERAHLDHHDQKVTFTGEKLLTDPEGQTLHADTEQPRFHVEHAVGGSEEAPLNLWRIVHLTDHEDQRLIEQFSRMWQSPWLSEFIEIYIRTDLHLGLTRTQS